MAQITKTYKMLHAGETSRALLERPDFTSFVLGRKLMDKSACDSWMASNGAVKGGIFAANDEYSTLLYSGPALTVAIEFYKVRESCV